MTFIADASTRVKDGWRMRDNTLKCALCGGELGALTYRSMPKWNILGLICGQCYDKKLLEHYIAPDRRQITKR